MSSRVHQWISVIGLVVLLALHLDFWRPERRDIYFGWLPEELAYRLVWIALAFLYLLHFCSKVWVRKDPA